MAGTVGKLAAVAAHKALMLLLTLASNLSIIIMRVFAALTNKFRPVRVAEEAASLAKLPAHAAVLAGTSARVEDAAEVAAVLSAAGIKSISLWDPEGRLHGERDRVAAALLGAHAKLAPGTAAPIITQRHDALPTSITAVRILGREEGSRASLVSAGRAAIHSKLSSAEPLKQDEVAEFLPAKGSDPDLLIIVGTLDSTLGFSPWHLAVTEISLVPFSRCL